MTKRYVEPESDDVVSLLSIVFGDGVTAEDFEPDDISGSRVARMIDDEDKLVGVCICDLPFVCFSGAALSMMPAGAAEDAIKAGEVSDTVRDNFYEVMNICSKLMMSDNSDHLRLDDVIDVSDASEVLGALSDAPISRRFTVTVPGYGEGKMAFIAH